ncbi:MAG: hypothetical protein KDC35_09710 [Acidobacteria bacterium]|nr:hypothetical protein [Acidobacteriota bacterium]
MAKKIDLDEAVKLFQEKQFGKASKAMDTLISTSELDIFTLNRLRQFKTIADRQSTNGSSDKEKPTLNQAVFFMNRRDYANAEEILDQIDISQDVSLYLKSEIAAEQGRLEKAAEFLQKAVSLNRDNVGYAKNSRSFHGHLNDKKFAFLFTK